MIKKICVFLLVALIIYCESVSSFSEKDMNPVTKETALILGDADGDGEVSDWDSMLFDRFLVGWTVEIDLSVMDLDGDGEISDWDAMILKRFLAGWDITFGVPPGTIKKYTVTYLDTDGITILKKQEVSQGGDVEPPSPPTKPGVEFVGWCGNYVDVSCDEVVRAVYSDSPNIFIVSGEEKVSKDEIIKIKLSLDGKVSVIRYALSITYDSSIFELIDFDSDISVFSPIATNPEKDNNGHLVTDADGCMNMSWASSVNKTRKADIIEIRFRVKGTKHELTSIIVNVEAVKEMKEGIQADVAFSFVNKVIEIN